MSDPGAERRQFPRLPGPFDGFRTGVLEFPLQIYDLSLGGCFINWFHDVPDPGRVFSLRIELPTGDSVTLQAETLYGRPAFGYAVRFRDLAVSDSERIQRALDALTHERA